mgnify:CR=1 FL=1
MSYYEIINGIKYDKGILDAVKECIKGRGDGRISQDDIHNVIKCITDKNKITKIEYLTIFYILQNFNFTEKALDIFAEFMSKQ